MEQVNSLNGKKIQQLEIFTKFASALVEEQQKLQDPYCYISNDKEELAAGGPSQRALVERIQEKHKEDEMDSAQLILRYDDFVNLITSSKRLYSKFTDHSFNLNQISQNAFGCIFFAIDENNKGYLTLNDWFHFNNLLENDNYHLIILYEFFRKFDVERIKAKKEKVIEWAKRRSLPSAGLSADDIRVKSINYDNKFLSFDDLFLNLKQFKETINLLHESVQDEFAKKNNLFLDWNTLKFLKFYECSPYGNKEGPHLSLNSIVTILQNDLKNEKLFLGFDKLSHIDPCRNCFTLSKNQLVYLLKLFYSHRIPADVFESLNLTNTNLIKSHNNSIAFNVFKDIFYLFQNFDLLNQALIKNATMNDYSERDLREGVISKSDFMSILNTQYNRVNNINEFSPSQINLLFSIVGNAKENNKIQKLRMHHQDSRIEDFIQNEYAHGISGHEKRLESFNSNYQELAAGFDQDCSVKNSPSYTSNGVFSFLSSKQDNSQVTYNLTTEDFMKILNPNYLNDLVHQMELHRIQQASLYTNYYFYPIFDSIYNFSLGSIAGCIGATVVYPIDLVKTRLQTQRSVTQYKNSIDCFVKIFSREGIRGLYSGLGPQLMGVAPEKAIKLTVNDYMRKTLGDKSGKLSLTQEIASGASAGACQVVFTNPLEIVKIRLQVRSEYVTENIGKSQETAFEIVKKLGFTGLYRGICACLMRDVPFSAIYFPTYAHIKRDIFNFDPQDDTKRSRLKTWELLLAGGLAGMPSAFLTTPFDVIKTRLQVDPRKGETPYGGILHAAKTILKEESFRSFFKGGAARVLRSSPQFGFTLAAYELFKGLLPLPDDRNIESLEADDEIPTVTNSFTSFFSDLSLSSHPTSYMPTQPEFFSPIVDPYSTNYLNYYYKSCQVAKLFIDLDNNFSKFDFRVYSKFHDYLKRIGSSKN
ncbi:hypothetical protein HG535_0B03360 [Zygotorulaspora mrakii]|uniref:Mitochondrial aspartate-glutamate transporter AGC1 n=1 Tax=Zygotorulaspora mrakii TaxID=42260 RepID=A0A7H9AYR0_ZYGMR|nr:uncharacterized protein HG535_0B03360 [Zygotorulaspora mrakii]QLG71297.1 hypothetical protein HG535_0B03360 [Zygotorulaspora mrakii]